MSGPIVRVHVQVQVEGQVALDVDLVLDVDLDPLACDTSSRAS